MTDFPAVPDQSYFDWLKQQLGIKQDSFAIPQISPSGLPPSYADRQARGDFANTPKLFGDILPPAQGYGQNFDGSVPGVTVAPTQDVVTPQPLSANDQNYLFGSNPAIDALMRPFRAQGETDPIKKAANIAADQAARDQAMPDKRDYGQERATVSTPQIDATPISDYRAAPTSAPTAAPTALPPPITIADRPMATVPDGLLTQPAVAAPTAMAVPMPTFTAPTGNASSNGGIGDFFSKLIGSASAGDPSSINPNTGLTNAQTQLMASNMFMNLGGTLLAAGEPMFGPQRAQILAKLGNAAPDPNMISQMQTRLLENNKLTRENAQQANLTKVMSSPEFQAQFSGMTPQMQALAKAAAASGDINGVMSLVEKSQPKVSTDGTVFDPASKTITNIYTGQRYNLDGTPVAPAGGAAAGSATPNNGSLTGDDYLKSLPEGGFKNTIQGIVNGDIPPPPLTARNGYSQEVIRGVTQADPSFSFNDANARKAFVQDNAKGARNQQALTLGTFANHLNSVADAASKLPNGELPAFNAATNEFLNQTGDPRVKQFNTEIHALQGEAGKMFRAGVVTDQEMRELSSNISSANSPEQLRGVLDSFRTLVQGRVNSLDSRGEQIMGKAWNPDKYSVITPDTRKQLDQYDSNSWGRPKAPANQIDQAALEAEARRRGLIK